MYFSNLFLCVPSIPLHTNVSFGFLVSCKKIFFFFLNWSKIQKICCKTRIVLKKLRKEKIFRYSWNICKNLPFDKYYSFLQVSEFTNYLYSYSYRSWLRQSIPIPISGGKNPFADHWYELVFAFFLVVRIHIYFSFGKTFLATKTSVIFSQFIYLCKKNLWITLNIFANRNNICLKNIILNI